ETQNIVMGYFLHETDTARTKNAAFVIERHARSELYALRFLHLLIQKARAGCAEFDAVFLQMAFPGLIADWAVQRMVYQEKLHHPISALLHQWRICANCHPFCNILRTGYLGARYPIDDGLSVGAYFRFPIRARLRHPHLDQAHPAIARRAQFWMITIMRNE